MGNMVCSGATLQCSFGTTPSTFAASGEDCDATSPAGVATDVGADNVPPFGDCVSLANPEVAAASAGGPLVPMPCVPVLEPWTPGSERVTIDDVSALDDTCQCSCAWGGVVTISSPGQLSATVL
jgi:hypothetical protein